MGKARSARGELVDFDLIKIKNQLAASESSGIEVARRQRFIDNKEKNAVAANLETTDFDPVPDVETKIEVKPEQEPPKRKK